MRKVLFALLMLLAAGAARAADCPAGTWRTVAPLPVARTEVSGASDGQAVYIAGGMASDPQTDLTSVFRYDPAADGWTIMGRLDAPVNHTGLVVLDGRLYVVGGYEGPRNAPTARLRALDLKTGELRELAPMPTARGALAAVVLDGKIHALGGTTDRSVATHEVYDPALDRWSSAAPMRVPRNHLAGAALGGKIYAFGGRDERTMLLDAAEAYDPATDSWSDVPAVPTGRSGIGAALRSGTIVVLGGEVAGQGGHTFANAEAFDPVANSWTELTPMPTARHGLGVAAAGGNIYAVSGGPQPGLTVSEVNEVLCGG